MIQEINLYQPMFRREHKVFSAATLAEITGVVLLALLGIYAWQAISTVQLENRLAQARRQETQAMAKLSRLVGRQTHSKLSPALSSALAQAQQTLSRQKAAMQILSQPSLSNTDGFSRPLHALGAAAFRGLWLTRVALTSGGTQIELEGRMSSASLLPSYLNALGKQPPFAGERFSLLRIERDKSHPHSLSFTLSTAVKKSGSHKQ